MAGNTLHAARKAKMFLGSGLHIHPVNGQIQRICNMLRHLRNERSYLGSLSNQRHIHIAHAIALRRHLFAHQPQQFQGIRTFISGVSVWKMVADVPESCCSQQGIRHRMEEHIRVAVTQKPLFKGNMHAAQNQIPAFH